MPKARTYLDANVLLAAWRGQGDIAKQAMDILDDPERELVVSDAVWLELMPKAIYNKAGEEAEFYETIFTGADHVRWQLDVLYRAHELAQNYGIGAMDAIHVATALDAGVDEFVSGEKPSKPMFRVSELLMVSLRNA